MSKKDVNSSLSLMMAILVMQLMEFVSFILMELVLKLKEMLLLSELTFMLSPTSLKNHS